MGLVKRVHEAFESGREGRWSSLVGLAYGHATLNAVGSESHSELRKELNEITKQPAKKGYGLLEKAAYRTGLAFEYLIEP